MSGVEVESGIGTIESTYGCRRQDIAWHKARIDADAIDRGVDLRPMRYAPASVAPVEPQAFGAPCVHRGPPRCRDAHFTRPVIGPEHAVATTDRAIAVRDPLGWMLGGQGYRTAMTGGFDHGSVRGLEWRAVHVFFKTPSSCFSTPRHPDESQDPEPRARRL